ncbi:hypothetical protein JZY06_00805 [Corynebacterium sp. CCM 8862]|uniref:Uncharacterized protein n=1 Tax=Corynebacterium mendelii TaxID=2765362 RepID=A0A939IX10_9CORY|nr:hypothetical protein [Corynebacterium mendelii]MBN9643177.1 hypothetical protein [Corynebacterium mendelii]
MPGLDDQRVVALLESGDLRASHDGSRWQITATALAEWNNRRTPRLTTLAQALATPGGMARFTAGQVARYLDDEVVSPASRPPETTL